MEQHWKAMYPTISTGGQCIIISTVNGLGNWYQETYYNAKRGKYTLVEMHTRFADITLPKIQTIDIRKAHLKKQMTQQFAPKMLNAMTETLKAIGFNVHVFK